ncbi:MAG: lytic murein transglycosylase [Rhodobacteraceae bacterium]|nr:lytic murein transglycosylase [Paracoccaceae bacterium]
MADKEISFEQWVEGFKTEALTAGISPDVVEAAFADITLNERVVELDQRQPEYVTPIWEYVEKLVSPERINAGLAAMQMVSEDWVRLESDYGVPRHVVAAIWGVESNFGKNRGDFYVVEALATLAYDGRREDFGKTQLFQALKILENGDIDQENMLGSWAGAMGHTQFIPTSFARFAVDFDGKPGRNIWSDIPLDALASTANYLRRHGWTPGQTWGGHVLLPEQFDYNVIGNTWLTAAGWRERGVMLDNGDTLEDSFPEARLIIPAGHKGPAFLVTRNFEALLKYNNSILYALAVSLMSDRLAQKPEQVLNWPIEDLPLSKTESKELQQALSDLGFDVGEVDGLFGSKSRGALRDFQLSQSLVPDGYPSVPVLEMVRGAVVARNAPVLAIASSPVLEADIREIQALLSGLGFDTGGIDGSVGPRTRDAIAAFAVKRGMPYTDEPTQRLLVELRSAARGE